jgi:hypothetical protein
MIPFPSRLIVSLALIYLLSIVGGAAVLAAQDDPPDRPPAEPETIPEDRVLKDLDIKVWGPWKQTAERDYLFEGKVTITWRESRIQADRMSLTQGRYIEAEGNILIVWEGNRISGTRLTYDLEEERGFIENAMGQVQTDFLFWAKRVEKVGDKTLHLKSGRVTTCTQPVPYWSFAVTSATVTVDRYARMWNVLLRTSKVPIFYSPYLIWPVKSDRALGLLFPEFHTNETLGQSITQELFIPLGRSTDLTLLGEYYTQAGFGYGGEFRHIPNRRGAARLEGFFIDDKASVKNPTTGELWGNRYSVTYQQTQEFLNGFRMAADINIVSDFSYYSDYERELDLISSPTILQRIEFSRNGPWTSMNVREQRREQLFGIAVDPDTNAVSDVSLLQETLPEIEFRGRSRKLGRTPLYLQYESSLASISQQGTQGGQPIDADYLRGDLFPTFSLPWAPTPWLDITPRANYRLTYYTQQQQTASTPGQRSIVDQNLTRDLWGAGLLIVGPKISRIFGSPSSRQYKHSLETRVSYGFEDFYDDFGDIIVYDEVDVFNGAGNAVNYGLTQRLFTKRPRAPEATVPTSQETIMLPDGTVSEAGGQQPRPDPTALLEELKSQPAETVEVASLEISQRRSFDEVLSQADMNGDGMIDDSSPYSNIAITGRYNPDPSTSLDLRSTYDILYKSFSGATLSGGVRRRLAQLRFSLVYRNGLGGFLDQDGVFVETPNDTQLRLTTGFTLLDGRLRLMIDGTVDFDRESRIVGSDPVTGDPVFQKTERIPNKSWRVQYSTQCCTLHFERLSRNFTGSVNDREDFYFRVDFKGIGKILQVTY